MPEKYVVMYKRFRDEKVCDAKGGVIKREEVAEERCVGTSFHRLTALGIAYDAIARQAETSFGGAEYCEVGLPESELHNAESIGFWSMDEEGNRLERFEMWIYPVCETE